MLQLQLEWLLSKWTATPCTHFWAFQSKVISSDYIQQSLAGVDYFIIDELSMVGRKLLGKLTGNCDKYVNDKKYSSINFWCINYFHYNANTELKSCVVDAPAYSVVWSTASSHGSAVPPHAVSRRADYFFDCACGVGASYEAGWTTHWSRTLPQHFLHFRYAELTIDSTRNSSGCYVCANLWVVYIEMVNGAIYVGMAWAVTIHKAQGSSHRHRKERIFFRHDICRMLQSAPTKSSSQETKS